jgi:magnesium transporter
MLCFFPALADGEDAASEGALKAVWLDLLDPSPAEAAAVEAILGAPMPSRDSLVEIETSSRLRRLGEVLFMSTPSAMRRPEGALAAAPVGFVLSPQRLVTVRYAPLPAFDAVVSKFEAGSGAPSTGLEVFTELCEAIVGRVADLMERLAEELNALSVAAFHADDTRGRHAARANRLLRIQLRQVGRLGDRLSEVRDALLGLGRVVAFTDQFTCDWCGGELKPRLASLRQDIHALNDYDEQLSNKVQFVLDALVGLIGIAQNDVFKVLTIVSIVGIPPTLMAGVYGMNFKNMPEYNWAFGYQYGWAVIILSAIIPLVWFKVKGWF